ncbi:TPA: VRR-NUC domain-containing protein [Streptococcus suis]|nr:VRR-NUC domain-containing protein [Streptococcus suis]
MEKEHKIQNDIRVGLTEVGCLVFRANVGKVRTSDGRYFDTGLPRGFSDLFGFRPDGQIFFIEVKNKNGRVRPEQEKFIERMKKRGALAGVARSVEDALDIVGGKANGTI